MKLMASMLVLFTLISLTGFAGAFFFGAAGAAAVILLGLAISFFGIGFFIGR